MLESLILPLRFFARLEFVLRIRISVLCINVFVPRISLRRRRDGIRIVAKGTAGNKLYARRIPTTE
ncbi:hypothetical protein SAMN05443244_3074 [Terriglobus roseus]|uniref:Uncharacterized protein n=1 Tax=Terriglobus roseus TaxID=392734 RepID=A0A1H4R7M8_9BACT|nr:hypothetical protein SAMN05443244_3074 [Terriglobus roseus]